MTEPVVVPASERWTHPDAAGGAGLRVTLSVPVFREDAPVHVLVVFDGDTMFLTATEFARTIRMVSLGTYPQVAVVGVMRDEPDQLRYISSRFRDFTPQEWHLPGPFEPDNAFAVFGTGGAPALADEVQHAVLPEVQRRLAEHGMTVGETCIAGWSLSGLFASWAWLHRPEVFAHMIAISPSLWWHDASILDAPVTPMSSTRRAFICAGQHEEGDPALVWPPQFANPAQRELAAMVRNAARFASMAADAGADVCHIEYPDEHHITLQAAAITRGLRHVFR